MKDGGIGIGWAPEEPKDEQSLLAVDLMKDTINSIWKKPINYALCPSGMRYGFR